ncbi:eukaryotic translation initiation factor 4E1-like [Teleopsis dalmanni]|uniref:eukaryotic translation initiation factor 4E1-like n=1 Tax=Teleopsis dalmanni TaxID=139649 RepID=UPI0018CF5B86|nr:eukaryotic translation initiation factor 4E1-like [Teleopsis dalmanni]
MNAEVIENMQLSDSCESSSSDSQILPSEQHFMHGVLKDSELMYAGRPLQLSGTVSMPNHFALHFPMEHIRKHKLLNSWTMWYLENDRSRPWDEMQNEIISFDTVEEFWLLYSRIKPPSALKIGSDYSLFRKGIRPMWEDDGNKYGGRWIITLNKTSTDVFNSLWLDTMLVAIGENFAQSGEICGVVVNIRTKINKIAIWTRHSQQNPDTLTVGCFIRDVLNLGSNNLQFHAHIDTIYRHGNNVRPIYIV